MAGYSRNIFHKLTPEIILARLDRIPNNSLFRGPDKQRKFQKFAVNEILAWRSLQLKASTIAVEVYGRNEKFNPQVDSIVCVEAGRLCRTLEHHSLSVGKKLSHAS